jgi:hypothetical protein
MAMVVLCVLGVVLYTKGNTKAKTETTLLAAADTTTTAAATTTTAPAAGGPATTAAAAAGAGGAAAAAGAAGGAAAAAGAAGAGAAKPGGPVAPAAPPTTARVILLRPCTLAPTVPTDIIGATRYLQCAWQLNDKTSALKVAAQSAVDSLFALGPWTAPITAVNCGTSTSTCTSTYHGTKTITYGFESGKVTAVSVA